MAPTLSDLLAPVSVTDFVGIFRSKKALHIVASNPKRAESLFPWREINRLLSADILDESVSVQRDGTLVPRKRYTFAEDTQLNVDALHGLLAEGVSIIANGVHRSNPQIGQFAIAVERELGMKTQINAYLSFSKGGAFKPHWDNQDILIVQVHGQKLWRFWDPKIVNRLTSQQLNANLPPPTREVNFLPGDVFYIPRGVPHAAAVSGAHSVHLSVGLSPLNGVDALDHLRKAAVIDELLRMDLPRVASEKEFRAHEAGMKQRLHRLIDAFSLADLLLADDLGRPPHPQTSASGALPQMEDVLHLTLRRRIPLPEVSPTGDPQLVTIGGEARELSPASIDVIGWLFEHDPAPRRALNDALSPLYEQTAIEAALRELLRFGFLAVD